jgi:peptidoglycan/xylan/chitin deacetylase (PgdA/CDA1 family)
MQISDWITRKSLNQPLPKRACAVTFDDGWADNYEFAFPLLQEMNIPATIYLTSDLIGSERLFWPERLSRIVTEIARNQTCSWDSECLQWLTDANTSYNFSARPPGRDELAELIAHAKKNTDQENHRLIDNIENTLLIDSTVNQPSLLNWHQIDEMLQSGLIEFGSHTCNHIRLNDDTANEVVIEEITRSKQNIEQHIGQTVNSFCFPNGDYSPFSLELVKQLYNSALTTMPGWNTIDTDNYLLRRIAIHEGNSHDGVAFKARLSGWM